MAALTSTDQFLDVVRKSKLVDEQRLDQLLAQLPDGLPDKPRALAEIMLRYGYLTTFQAMQLLQGKSKGFLIANEKYKLLEHLGSGGMGTVYLCEHLRMKRRVALKVIPKEKLTSDATALERFEREARAAGALDHPNLVRAHDLDTDGKMHFLVMEYIEGASLQDIVKKFGPMDITRAAHYISQAAEGLQHAHDAAGLVHRDIKPGNILIDRGGTVKILDMGLARFFRDDDPGGLTKKYEKNAVLGTADYLAPEQAVNSSDVDIRADIYGLGATFYFLLCGRSPFNEGSVTEKLIWCQMRNPDPVSKHRPEVPKELEAVLNKMMAKKDVHRYQQPMAVVEALRPWTDKPIEPPADEEMPRLCPALENYSPNGPSLPASGVNGSLSGVRLRAPRSGPRSSSYSRASLPRSAAAGAPLRARWLYAALAGAVLLAAGATVTYFAMRPNPPAKAIPAVTKSPTVPPKVEPPPTPPDLTPPPPVVADALYVARAGKAPEGRTAFPTVAAALAAAKPGQTIVVLENLSELLKLDGRTLAGVRLESGLSGGQRVVWTPPTDVAADQPLIDLIGAAGVTLKGFVLDGNRKVSNLIRVRGESPGLTLDDLQLTEATQASVLLDGCASSAAQPVTVRGVRMETVKDYAKGDNLVIATNADTVRPAAVLAMGTSPGTLHLTVSECRIEGMFKAGVRLEVPCAAEVKLNRFYTLKDEERPKAVATCDAVSVQVPTAGPIKLKVASNTVARYIDLLRLDRIPETSSGCTFELRSNLMIGGLAFVEGPRGANVEAAKPLFAGSLGNVARPATCNSGLKVIEKVSVDFKFIDVTLGSSSFLIYKKSGDTEALYTAGAGGEPAGVPPKD